jgi:hypothetical protein
MMDKDRYMDFVREGKEAEENIDRDIDPDDAEVERMIRASREREDSLSPEVQQATEDAIYNNRLRKAFGYDAIDPI